MLSRMFKHLKAGTFEVGKSIVGNLIQPFYSSNENCWIKSFKTTLK